MSRFDDYIRDIPLEIHERFYPKSQIILPLTLLPRLANVPVYNFDVEQRARRAYESRNDKEEPLAAVPSVEPVQMLHPSPSTSSLPNTLEILQPSRVDNSIVGIPVVPPEAKPVMSFEEFESKGTVFDEVEWRSIDDRKALSQILNGNASSPSETATQAPIPAPRQSVFLAGVNLRSYPNLSRSINHETQHAKIINGSTVSYSSPDSSKTVGTVVVDQAKETTKTPLRERLLTKGYRENLVNVATAKVPRQRIVHIEYYMKGMSVLEKRGVSAEESLTYLLESGVTDKQDILQRADAADGLLAMELNRKDVFAALLKADGDKQKAFDIIMP